VRRSAIPRIESVAWLCIFRSCEKAAGIAAFPLSGWEFFALEPLTMAKGEYYISPLGAPPLGAMARLRSPSLFSR
jgi:hypothetical protein